MRQEQIIHLFEYHWSTTERLLRKAEQLPQDVYYARPERSPKSVHQLLFHILAADRGWRVAVESGVQKPGLKAEDYPDIAALKNLLAEESLAWRGFLARLSDEDLNSDIKLKSLRGRERIFPQWRILIHLLLHGMQHQSELAQLLSEQDLSPGDIDFIFFSG